jgi:1,4-dihydroxy-2-naphthoate octaprenyltransferase
LSYKHTDFLCALRPFSLVVALATCGLGITLAALDGFGSPLIFLLLVLAGLLLQGGANLINDHADLSHARFDDQQRQAIIRNARLGWLGIALASLIGCWFVWLHGWPMLALGAAGVLGIWNYADGPLNFKARGLGIVVVFFLTGVMMVEGAYFAASGHFTMRVVWLSIPFSLYASLLLLANELRDYERDLEDGHRTLTVRYGFAAGLWLYRSLALSLVVSTCLLAIVGDMLALAIPLLALALLWLPLGKLAASPAERASLAQLTGRCYLAYASAFVAALWVSAL